MRDHVLSGRLPGSGIEGRFVMFGDAPEMRSRGQEMAFSSDRPLAANAILVRAGRELTRDRAESLAQLPDQYRLEVNGRDLLVWRPIQGNMIRTAAGSDNFCTKAGEVVRRVEAASGLGGGASGTMPRGGRDDERPAGSRHQTEPPLSSRDRGPRPHGAG
jgi:hypothetical protein